MSLPEGLSPVDALDLRFLPKSIAPWVSDIGERMQCPPDYVGSTSLIALGSVLGRKIGIAPDRQTDWFEVPNLWQCAVGRPGAMKTPAIGEALKPLHRLEVKAREKYEAEAVDYGKALYEWKLRKDAAEAKAKADLKKNPEAKVSFDIAEPQAPIERRFITNDTTYEKLGEILGAESEWSSCPSGRACFPPKNTRPGGVCRGAWFLPDRVGWEGAVHVRPYRSRAGAYRGRLPEHDRLNPTRSAC